MAQLTRDEIIKLIRKKRSRLAHKLHAAEGGLDGAILLSRYNARYDELSQLLDSIQSAEV